MMHPIIALCSLAAAAASAHAFVGTYPVVAWSQSSLPNLAALDAVSPRDAARAAASRQVRVGGDVRPEGQLCDFDALYIFSAPGLHASDLDLLPSRSAPHDGSQTTMPTNLDHVRVVPYVSDRLAVAPVAKIAQAFSRCGSDKQIRFARSDALYADAAHVDREDAGAQLDSELTAFVADAPARSVFVLTDLPAKLPASAAQHVKRQQLMPTDSSSATIEELLEEIAYEEGSKADAFGEMIDEIEVSDPAEIVSSESDSTDPSMADAWDRPVLDVSSAYQNGTDGNNGTSIFAPKDGSGVLHRYALFSPALIVAVLVTLAVLVPTVLVGMQALLSIETVNGLETKMTGSVGIDPSKQ